MSRRAVIQNETLSPWGLKSWQRLQEFSTSQGLPLQFSMETVKSLLSLQDRPDLLAFRGTLEFSQSQMQSLHSFPADVSQVQGFDHWVFEKKQFWPRLLWPVALRQLIVLRTGPLDLKQSCFIVSQGVTARMAAWLAVSLGYSQIVLVGDSADDLQNQSEKLRRILVGVDIFQITSEQLTLQTYGCSLLINTLDLSQNENLLSDLAYFNFMRTGGVILDVPSDSLEQPLIPEAQSAGLFSLHGSEIQACFDYQLLLCLQKNSDQPKDYANLLKLNLAQFIELMA